MPSSSWCVFAIAAVGGNSSIWWRFAIRAVCRLQHSGMDGNNTGAAGDTYPQGPLAVEETLKVRLWLEKASTYRLLRLLQLQGKATERQQEQLAQLRDTLPLPQLLRSHALAGQDFLQEQEAAKAAAKSWPRWLPLWRGRQPKHGTPGSNTAGGTRSAAGGSGAGLSRPPLPPLSFQKLLDQQKRQGETRQQQQQQEYQHEVTSGEAEKALSDLDDFFDATSQVRLSLGLSAFSLVSRHWHPLSFSSELSLYQPKSSGHRAGVILCHRRCCCISRYNKSCNG